MPATLKSFGMPQYKCCKAKNYATWNPFPFAFH